MKKVKKIVRKRKPVRRTQDRFYANSQEDTIHEVDISDMDIVILPNDTISVGGQLHLPYKRPSNSTAYWKVGV